MVHRLTDGDPTTIPTCHCIPINLTTDRKSAGRLRGRPPQDACGRHPAHVRTVLNLCPKGGFRGSKGLDFSHTGATREAADGGAVDQGEGDGGHTSARGAVHEDGVEVDGGAAHQTSRGLPINSGQPGLVTGMPTRARPG